MALQMKDRLGEARRFVVGEIARTSYRRIYRRLKAFTMISEGTFIRNLELAERASHVRGCIVECGVWRGGMIAGIATVMGTDRNYYLCDSFEGLPPATQLDGAAALRWQSDVTSPHYHDNCTAEEGYARELRGFYTIGDLEWIIKDLKNLNNNRDTGA